MSNATGNYQPETCAWCKGTGEMAGEHGRIDCYPCEGRGSVRVLQPSRQCVRCGGSGSKNNSHANFHDDACATCAGTGWAHSWQD